MRAWVCVWRVAVAYGYCRCTEGWTADLASRRLEFRAAEHSLESWQWQSSTRGKCSLPGLIPGGLRRANGSSSRKSLLLSPRAMSSHRAQGGHRGRSKRGGGTNARHAGHGGGRGGGRDSNAKRKRGSYGPAGSAIVAREAPRILDPVAFAEVSGATVAYERRFHHAVLGVCCRCRRGLRSWRS